MIEHVGSFTSGTGILLVCIMAILFLAIRRHQLDVNHLDIAKALDETSSEIYVFNAQTLQLIDVNRNAVDHLGYSNTEIRGLQITDIHPDHFTAKLTQLINRMRRENKQEECYRTTIVRRDGTLYPVEVSLRYSKRRSGPVLLLIAHDITEKQYKEDLQRRAQVAEEVKEELEREVKVRTAELERANQVKEDFINVVSHELRTPLTTMKSFAEVLRTNMDVLDKDTIIDFMTVFDHEYDRLTNLVDNLFDLQSFDSGRATWRDEKQNIKLLLEESIDFYDDAFKKKNIKLIRNIPNVDESFSITIDSDKFKQITSNILANALKFTAQGAVTVTLERMYPGATVLFLCSHENHCAALVKVLEAKGVKVVTCVGDIEEHHLQEHVSVLLVDSGLTNTEITPLLMSSIFQDIPIISCSEDEKGGGDDMFEGSLSISTSLPQQEIARLLDLFLSEALPNNTQYKISISDTGVGIPEEEVIHIFERFHQAKTSVGENQGSGLGLSICREYVEHYQGQISVESKESEGSTFTITLPAVQAEKKRLGEILVDAGLVTDNQIQQALEKQSNK